MGQQRHVGREKRGTIDLRKTTREPRLRESVEGILRPFEEVRVGPFPADGVGISDDRIGTRSEPRTRAIRTPPETR